MLRDVVAVQTGVFGKTVKKGAIVYLQSRYFNEHGQLISSLHPDLLIGSHVDRHLLKRGDVLFAAKGSKNFAAMYELTDPPAVASTSFFVLRLKEDFRKNVLPEYLKWFLNHPISQEYLKGRAIGSSIVSISKRVLEEMEISVPELKTQKAILEIAELRTTEKKLKDQLEALRERKIQQQIVNAIK